MSLTHIPSRLEVEPFGILHCGLWGRCGSSLAEDQRGQVPSGFPTGLSSPPESSCDDQLPFLNLPPAPVSSNLSAFVFPPKLLALLLPLQFHTQNGLVQSRLTFLEIMHWQWCAVWEPCKAVHGRAHLESPGVATRPLTNRRASPSPLGDCLHFSVSQRELDENWCSRICQLQNTKSLGQYQPWLVHIAVLHHMPLVWEVSGSCRVSQTWHQAAIKQLKHFIFHDNCISLPDLKTFPPHFIEKFWFTCWQIKRCS